MVAILAHARGVVDSINMRTLRDLVTVLDFFVLSPPITDLRKRVAFLFILFRVDGFIANTRNIAIGYK